MTSQLFSCPICSQKANLTLRESFGTEGRQYQLYQCDHCGVGHWQPFKNPGSEWYERDERYSGINSQPFLDIKPGQKALLNKLKPGKLFDIGCGTGNFLTYAQQKGWEVSGIDFDRNAIQAARAVFNLKNVEVNDLAGFIKNNPKQQFDLVTFFDVFEHIDNHREFIEHVGSLVTSGGRLVMTLPYGGAWRWLVPHDLPPRHLTRWTDVTLKRYLEHHGWQVESISKEPATLEYLLMKLRFRFGKFLSFGLVNKMRRRVTSRNVGEKKNPLPTTLDRVARLARLKDWIVFGLPAGVLWVALYFTDKRYVGLFVIAKKHTQS